MPKFRSEYTPEKVAELIAEARRYDRASITLELAAALEVEHKRAEIVTGRVIAIAVERDELRAVIEEAKTHEWSNYGDSETRRILSRITDKEQAK